MHKKCLKYNRDPSKKKIDLCVYAPDKILHDTLDFSPDKIALAIYEGLKKFKLGPINLEVD